MSNRRNQTLGITIAGAVIAGVIWLSMHANYRYPAAIYKNFEFHGQGNKLYQFHSSRLEHPFGQVFVELESGEVYALDKLPEQVAAQVLAEVHTGPNYIDYCDHQAVVLCDRV